MNKYELHYGIHRGTITSRDSDMSLFETEEAARESYRSRKQFHKSIGYSVWFAYLISPTGEQKTLDPGTTYS